MLYRPAEIPREVAIIEEVPDLPPLPIPLPGRLPEWVLYEWRPRDETWRPISGWKACCAAAWPRYCKERHATIVWTRGLENAIIERQARLPYPPEPVDER